MPPGFSDLPFPVPAWTDDWPALVGHATTPGLSVTTALLPCNRGEVQPDVGALSCIGGGICTSPDTPVATPTGNRPMAELRRGDLVSSEHHALSRVRFRALL
jgi:hypothetical protein